MAFRRTAIVLVTCLMVAHCAPPGDANAYVTFHVDEPCITSRVEEIQRELVSKDSSFEEALQSIPTLHVTINNSMSERTTRRCKRAKSAAQGDRELPSAYDSKDKRQVKVNGIGQFLPRTLLANFTEDRSRQLLQDLYKTVKDAFASEGIKPLNQYEPYQPHITILGLPKNTTCSSKAWQPLVADDHFLGVQKIKALQLCWMHSPDDGSFCRLISKSKL